MICDVKACVCAGQLSSVQSSVYSSVCGSYDVKLNNVEAMINQSVDLL